VWLVDEQSCRQDHTESSRRPLLRRVDRTTKGVAGAAGVAEHASTRSARESREHWRNDLECGTPCYPYTFTNLR